ncbi:peptidase U32 family protein [Caproiciproducens faecalis]|uniref:U32 family peptidase n=1 Tax=Caproiciproducens faecalis TaxID=2820301 RepID=A0ABS7DPT9_9FIRM|nr:U32 family peptidase [Caproiciproducens faecalis]MBW7573310.1 U32 family peptidase [Caproiciproducens faecalis]
MNQHVELLSPVGDLERLGAAISFGADAVYLAGQEFGMRTAPSNFTNEELAKAVQYAHEKKVCVYLTCNTVPHNNELARLPEFLQFAQDAGVDALIIADLGVMAMAKKYAPKVEIHMSTQAGIANYVSACELYDMGASRVVLARELNLGEIAEIRAKTPQELELEAFVHGAMCVSFSGRCLLSSYLTGRDANRGDCAQPCRWEYALMESKRPGQYMPISEDKHGTYILNSRDMCMIEHIPEILKTGITSLKIEGRAKSAYYVSVTTNAYRSAIDEYYANPEQKVSPWIVEELNKISHREYSTGFYLGTEPGQVYGNGGYVREYDVIAVCENYENGVATLSQRNRFFRGDTADVLEAGNRPFLLPLDELYDRDWNPIDSAPHAMMTVLVKTDRPLVKGAILRKVRA